jgi:predicted phosphoribosyltransferase
LKDIVDLPELRDRVNVFRDRAHAGQVLADMLKLHCDQKTIIMAIPAGGVPVAYEVTKSLKLELDVAVVSKMTLPWNTEAGYGAIAFDGTVRLNQALLQRLGLAKEEIQKGIKETAAKVKNRVSRLRGSKPFQNLEGRKVILIDDGLASGFTMIVAIEALRKSGAENVTVAVPTAHLESARKIIKIADGMFCPNLRSGLQFAVASAYEKWSDVTEEEVISILKSSTTCHSE